MSDWSKPLFVAGITCSAFLSGFIISTSLLPTTTTTTTDEASLTHHQEQQQQAHLKRLNTHYITPLSLLSASSFFLNAYTMYSPETPRRLRGFLAAGICALGVLGLPSAWWGLGLGGMLDVEKEVEKGRESVRRWGTLNAVRGTMGAVGTLLAFDASFARGIFV